MSLSYLVMCMHAVPVLKPGASTNQENMLYSLWSFYSEAYTTLFGEGLHVAVLWLV